MSTAAARSCASSFAPPAGLPKISVQAYEARRSGGGHVTTVIDHGVFDQPALAQHLAQRGDDRRGCGVDGDPLS